MAVDPAIHPVRRLTPSPEDLLLFRSVRLEALQTDPEAFGATLAEEAQRSPASWQAFLHRACGPGQVFLVSAGSGRAVGCCGAFVTPEDVSVGMLWGMWVHPGQRGTGLADALVQAAETFLAQEGVVRVVAHVTTTNARAMAFYVRRGFQRGAVLAPSRPGGRPVYVLDRPLPQP